jgi:hypothetical protein
MAFPRLAPWAVILRRYAGTLAYRHGFFLMRESHVRLASNQLSWLLPIISKSA